MNYYFDGTIYDTFDEAYEDLVKTITPGVIVDYIDENISIRELLDHIDNNYYNDLIRRVVEDEISSGVIEEVEEWTFILKHM